MHAFNVTTGYRTASGFDKILLLVFFTLIYCAIFIRNAYLKLIEDEKESARLQKMSKRRGKMVAFEDRRSHSDSEV